MVGDDEDTDKGELKYQESKMFNSEWFLCNAYDNTKARRITFEIYGLDTQDTFTKVWDYAAFDGLFRFNAELMNPNRKEGRFHYIIERLSVVTVFKDRELKLMPEPTEETPMLPIYETTRKIPTGRMDLKERQRLREQMDMLDIRRAENIAKRRQATKQKVLAHIMRLKEEDKKRKEEQEQKIEEEKKLRTKQKEEAERKEREEEARLEAMRKARRKAVEVKEERTEEQDEEEYRQLRARWRVKDAERAKNLADQAAKIAAEQKERRAAAEKHQQHLADVQARREVAWAARDERVRRKQNTKLKQILEVKHERERQAKLRLERNKEYLQLLHTERQPIFAAQLVRTEERKAAQQAEAQAFLNYKEKRAIPKKVNKKGAKSGKSRSSDKDEKGAKPKGKAKPKATKSDKGESETDGAGTDTKSASRSPRGPGKVDTEKALDAVEAKMRKEMEEAKKREMKQKKRDKKIQEKEQERLDKENARMAEVREAYRQNVTVKEETAAEKRLILAQKAKEAETAAERTKLDRARLDRVREQNIARKEMQRLAALCA
uniref:Uncharacterized protein n=1 Tax=Zooxanthella nutricula TaxID=1333877 RepID=A0A7S2IDU3_9DINO